MSIHLVTGTPGAGKTLYVVKKMIEELVPSGRKIIHNINGLNIEGKTPGQIVSIEGDDNAVTTWPDCEDGCIFIFDEVQRQFTVRNPAAKVPRYISEFETHRHRGFDFYLITQGPQLIDRHIHPLVETHTHLYRPYGLTRSRIFMWNSINPTPNPKQSRLTSQSRNFMFPKKYYAAYKSSVQHTIKARPPWLLLAGVPIGVAVIVSAGFYVRSSFMDMAVAKAPPAQTPENSPADGQLAIFEEVGSCAVHMASIGGSVVAVRDGLVGRYSWGSEPGSLVDNATGDSVQRC